RDITILVKNKPIQNYLELRDRDDYHILESAFAVNANYLITGDKDLLTLQKIKNFSIITPDEYLRLKEENEA
ncbi:putative toxin-antitoxin system toxin component, PIN family, partial [Leptospira santarosai]